MPIPLVYLEIQDEITDAYEKLNKAKGKKLVFVFPSKSPLGHSLVNLRLLYKRAQKLGKKIILVSPEAHVRKLASQVGFSVYTSLAEIAPPAKKEPKEKKLVAKARKKAMRGEDLPPVEYQFGLGRPSKKILLFLVVLSIAIFLVIVRLALPGATVYLEAKLIPRPLVTNVMLVDRTKSELSGERVVGLQPLDITFNKDIILAPGGKTFKGKDAEGEVTIINTDTTKEEWIIVNNSRLQTKEGLVFLTQGTVKVPRMREGKPGKLRVKIKARHEDANGNFIGDRGNIAATRFFFPGLSAYNQKFIWAESEAAMQGGETVIERFVLPLDIDRAKKKMEQELNYYTKAELEQALAEINLQEKKNYELFEKEESFIKKILEIKVEAQANQKKDNFTVKGKMVVKGYYYAPEEVTKILVENLEKHLSQSEKLVKVDYASLIFPEVLSLDKDKGIIKATSSLNTFVSYNFDQPSGLIDQVKDNIVGKTREESLRYLDNLSEINKSRIELWPFWSNHLPSIRDNIKIRIVEVK